MRSWAEALGNLQNQFLSSRGCCRETINTKSPLMFPVTEKQDLLTGTIYADH